MRPAVSNAGVWAVSIEKNQGDPGESLLESQFVWPCESVDEADERLTAQCE